VINSTSIQHFHGQLDAEQFSSPNFNGEIQLTTGSDNNLYSGLVKIGNKHNFTGNLAVHKSKRLAIVSRNCSFNSFKSRHVTEWRDYIYKQFFNGITFLCLQDFPYEYVESLSQLGHVIHFVYAVGDNGKLISNVIIAHPYTITKEEFDSCEVSYVAEKSNMCRDFISGCLLVRFPTKKVTIGSLYAHFATTVDSRRYELENRQNWISIHEYYTKSDVLICGNFNPRTKNSLFNEAPMLKTRSVLLNKVIYYVRLVPYIILGLFGETALKELKRNKKFGLVFPDQSTMKDKKVGWFTIPFNRMGAVMDLVQTNLPLDSVDVAVFPGDQLSDHYPIRVLIKKGSEY
jgi:hypothetical protein